MKIDCKLASEAQTIQMAKQIAKLISPPLVITLSGEIGAGKTTFVRALLRSLGVESSIKSPTFSLVESYVLPTIEFHHFDLYRIHDETELDYIGFRDYFSDNAVCCIEWPSRAINYIAKVDLACSLRELESENTSVSENSDGRNMIITAFTPRAKTLLSSLKVPYGKA